MGQTFEEMNLSPETLRAIADLGFEEATPIQSQTIGLLMSGKDVVGQSQTGTGKTAAFGIPLIELIDPDDKKLQAVILCPTRELAIQIGEEFRKLLKYRDNVKVIPIYGGQPIDRQISAIKKGCQIIVGTPGRVMDHMNRRTLKMETVSHVVLDEADEMLDMGFREDIEFILGKMPPERQTALFSATMPKEILDLTEKYQQSPERVRVVHKELTLPSTEQAYFELREHHKLEALCRLVDLEDPGLSLVFCNTKKRVDELTEQLIGRGYSADGLHGDLNQPQRDLVMRKFRTRTLEILVATDVAARGIDVDDIDVVFNYDLPQDEDYYVHRIGRTGRAGKTGRAYTFVVGKEIYRLREIMRFTNARITRRKLPTLADIEEYKTRAFVDKIKAIIDEGRLTKYVNIVESLVTEDYSAIDVAAALIKNSVYDSEAETMDLELESDYERSLAAQSAKAAKAGKPAKKDWQSAGEPEGSTVRLFITVGRKDKAKPSDIVGAIAGETGVSGKLIGHVEIYEEFTFVEVPKECAKDIVTALKGKKIKGKKVNVERAKAYDGKGKKKKE